MLLLNLNVTFKTGHMNTEQSNNNVLIRDDSMYVTISRARTPTHVSNLKTFACARLKTDS